MGAKKEAVFMDVEELKEYLIAHANDKSIVSITFDVTDRKLEGGNHNG